MEQSEVVRRAIEAVRAICDEPSAEHNLGLESQHQAFWSLESEAAIRRFHGQPHSRLFPHLGRKVRTPNGPGTLIQVFAKCALVLLDSDREGTCARFLPTEISPLALEIQRE